jgi:superoxide dismutase, Cu-Zn family
MRVVAWLGMTGVMGLGALGAGCAGQARSDVAKSPAWAPAALTTVPARGTPVMEVGSIHAEADLRAAPGARIGGSASFTEESDGVLVVLELRGAAPGKKAVYVHEKGDCSDIKALSLGYHFAADSNQQALPPEQAARHLGDLGSIEVQDDGKGRLEIRVEHASLQPHNPDSMLGRSIVVHAGEDFRREQPSGAAGTAVACGVIHTS